MKNRMTVANLYVNAYKHRAAQVATKTTKKIVENKQTLLVAAGTSVVVGLTTRATGFKAGYAFAKGTKLPPA